jgi:hypothetical protein
MGCRSGSIRGQALQTSLFLEGKCGVYFNLLLEPRVFGSLKSVGREVLEHRKALLDYLHGVTINNLVIPISFIKYVAKCFFD